MGKKGTKDAQAIAEANHKKWDLTDTTNGSHQTSAQKKERDGTDGEHTLKCRKEKDLHRHCRWVTGKTQTEK